MRNRNRNRVVVTKRGYWLTLPPALFFLVLLMTVAAAAKTFDMGNHTADQVKNKCAAVRGTFFQRGDKYGCEVAKGVIQCDANHNCLGYPKAKLRPRPAPAPPPRYVIPLPPVWEWREDRWQ